MKTIAELLELKGATPVHTVGPDESVFAAVTRMVEMNIGAVLVCHENVIQGILTERDYLRFVSSKGRTAQETPVRDLMTRKIVYVTPECSLDEVMAIMTEQRIRHVPAMFEGRLIGIVSIGDVVKQISRDQKVQIRTLEDYISDSYPGPKRHEAQA